MNKQINKKMNIEYNNANLSEIIIREISATFKKNLEGIVAFGSNIDLDKSNTDYAHDYDLLIVLSSLSKTSESEIQSLITTILLTFGIRIDAHLFDLNTLSRSLRIPDLIFIGIAKQYKIIYGTKRFKTVFQLIETIDSRHDYTVVL